MLKLRSIALSLLLIVLLPCALFGSYSTTIMADSPLVYLRLGEASGTTAADSSGNGHAGTYSGGVTLGQPGISGDLNTSAVFNGSSGQVDVPDAPALRLATWTIECWFKPANFTNYNGLIGKGTAHRNFLLLTNITTGQLLAQFTHDNGVFLTTAPSTALTVGQWAHCVATYDGNTISVYLNGVQLNSTAVGFNCDLPTEDLLIGAGAGLYSPGTIDEVAVYSTALSSTRVLAHFNAGFPTGGPLVAPTTALDLATNNGVIVSWGIASGGTGPYTYQLQRAPDSSGSPGTFVNVSGATASPFTDTGFAAHDWYRVVATDSTPTSANGSAVGADSLVSPTGVTVSSTGTTTATLTFNAVSGATYNIYRTRISGQEIAPAPNLSPPTPPTITPGAGWTGPTSTPGVTGSGPWSAYPAIAQWDVIPHQTFNGAFNVGVVAFHSSGINHVAFSCDNGPWVNCTVAVLNMQTANTSGIGYQHSGVVEYYATINASDCPADGPRTFRAIAYPVAGVPLVLPDLVLNSNKNGTLNERTVYCDSVSGNDATADGTSGAPYQTLLAAATYNTGGHGVNTPADNLAILCKAGTYAWPVATFSENPSDSTGWCRITSAPGVDPSAVQITSSPSGSGFNMPLVELDNISVVEGNGVAVVLEGNDQGAPQTVWMNRVDWGGPDPVNNTNAGNCINGFSNVYVIDTAFHDTSSWVPGANIERGYDYRNGATAFHDPQLIANSFTTDLYIPSGSGDHPDALQILYANPDLPGANNLIMYGVTAVGPTMDAQGMTIATKNFHNVAMVGCDIEVTGAASPWALQGDGGPSTNFYMQGTKVRGGNIGYLDDSGHANTSGIGVPMTVQGFRFLQNDFPSNGADLIMKGVSLEGQVASGVVTTTFNDANLDPGAKYFYAVTAVTSSGESPLSTEANGTTKGLASPMHRIRTGVGVGF